MRALLLALAALLALSGPAHAQLSYPPVDPAKYPTKAEVQAAITTATPGPCSTPLPDTLMGSPGSGVTCMPRTDASRPTVIQAKTTLTATDASWSVTWDRPFSPAPVYVDARVYGASQPYLCTISTSTETGASGKCYQLIATTLPSTVTSVVNLVISPFAAAGAGLSVRVVGRQ